MSTAPTSVIPWLVTVDVRLPSGGTVKIPVLVRASEVAEAAARAAANLSGHKIVGARVAPVEPSDVAEILRLLSGGAHTEAKPAEAKPAVKPVRVWP